MGLFTPDTSFSSDYADKGRYLLIWRLSLLFVVVFFTLAATFAMVAPISGLLYSLVFLMASLGLIYLHKTKKYKPIFWSFTISATTITGIALMMVMPIVHYAEFMWVVAIVIFAFVGLGRKVGVIFLIVNSIIVSIHMFVFLNPNLEAHKPHGTPEIIGTLAEMLFAMFTIAYLLHQYLLFQRYAESQLIVANGKLAARNEVIQKKNEENITLAKEIHHRVKNNLQIIISLLRMQRDEVRSDETRHHFSEAMNRIMAISLIHQKLYQEKELSNIDMQSYLEELSHEILTSSITGDSKVDCVVISEIPRVGLKTIVPLGLLLNELMTNSIKHAFTSVTDVGMAGEQPTILIHFMENDHGKISLRYSDNGQWRETSSEIGFGMELIRQLTIQLEGTFTRSESSFDFELGNMDH